MIIIGLDMYLTCNSRKVTEAAWGDSLPEPWRLVDGQVAYWRKNNAIHNWFVEHVQGGKDDCGTYPVEVEELEELHKTVCTVLGDPSVAEELLPTTDGFFFGSTDYDQWYWSGLEYTKAQIERILGAVERVEYQAMSTGERYSTGWMPKGEREWEVKFHYHSSW